VRPSLSGATSSECLRVLRPRSSTGNLTASASVPLGASASSADYLIPLTRSRPPSGTSMSHSMEAAGRSGERERERVGRNDSTTSLQEHSGYWETSFTREGVKAIARGEPLPDVALGSSSTGNLSMSSNSMKRRRSKGYAVVPPFDSNASTSGLNQSQSTQPLLETPPDSPSGVAMNGTINQATANLPEGVTLDASNLCRQSYANVRLTSVSPSRTNVAPTKAERTSSKPNEISC